jgi:hypothetical protein
MCDTPPVMNRKMTFLALPGKWGALGASGLPSADPRASSASVPWRMPGSRIDPAANDRITCRRDGSMDRDGSPWRKRAVGLRIERLPLDRQEDDPSSPLGHFGC